MPTLIHEQQTDTESQPNTSGLHVDQVVLDALERQLIERGDHQLRDEPNRGFEIHRLRHETPQEPVPSKELLPQVYLSGLDDTFERTLSLFSSDFTRRLTSGGLVLDPVDELPKNGLRLTIEYPIAASAYEAAVREGRVPAGLFAPEGHASAAQPGADTLESLVDPDQKRVALESAAKGVDLAFLRSRYIDDFKDLHDPTITLANIGDIREAFEARDGDAIVRIYNASATSLSEDRLREMINNIRAAADRNNGSKGPDTVLILSEDHPYMSKIVEDEEGKFRLPNSGFSVGVTSKLMLLSERAFQRPEDRKPLSERAARYYEKYFGEFRLPGEPAEGPGAPRQTAAEGDAQPLMAHEGEHIALESNDVELPGPGPTLYSRVQAKEGTKIDEVNKSAEQRKREHEAELAAIEHMGGQAALDVPEEQRHAKREMRWRQIVNDADDERQPGNPVYEYKRPIGPHYVVCTELDIWHGPLPPRLKDLHDPIPAKITYRLVSDA